MENNITYNITMEDSIEALRNEYREILETYNPKRVIIERQPVSEGVLCLLKITVKAPSFYLVSEGDTVPKSANELTFFAKVPNGFPKVKPTLYYPPNRRLASVNVFRSGVQCIDEWTEASSLAGVVEKTIKDIIHDPIVTRYDSMANSDVESWQKSMTERGLLPTIDPLLLYATKSTPDLPAERVRVINPAPPLPGRR